MGSPFFLIEPSVFSIRVAMIFPNRPQAAVIFPNRTWAGQRKKIWAASRTEKIQEGKKVQSRKLTEIFE